MLAVPKYGCASPGKLIPARYAAIIRITGVYRAGFRTSPLLFQSTPENGSQPAVFQCLLTPTAEDPLGSGDVQRIAVRQGW